MICSHLVLPVLMQSSLSEMDLITPIPQKTCPIKNTAGLYLTIPQELLFLTPKCLVLIAETIEFYTRITSTENRRITFLHLMMKEMVAVVIRKLTLILEKARRLKINLSMISLIFDIATTKLCKIHLKALMLSS